MRRCLWGDSSRHYNDSEIDSNTAWRPCTCGEDSLSAWPRGPVWNREGYCSPTQCKTNCCWHPCHQLSFQQCNKAERSLLKERDWKIKVKDAFIPGLPCISASTWSKMLPGTIWGKFRWISHSKCETFEIKTCYGEELSLLLWTAQTHQHTHPSFHIKRSFKVYKRRQTAYFHKSSLLACSLRACQQTVSLV